MQIVEAETNDYGADSATSTIGTGGCCISNCDGKSWERNESNPCNLALTISIKMSAPVYIYYKLTNFYQNHRRYVRSRDDEQLVGDESFTANDLEERTCTYHYRADWDSGNAINPCGLIAWSLFNDSYKLFRPDGSEVVIDDSQIAWQSDLDHKFHNSNDGTTGLNFPPFAFWRNLPCTGDPQPSLARSDLSNRSQDAMKNQTDACLTANVATPGVGWCFRSSGFCTEDPHFVVWMRSAGLPAFRKLFGKIDETLEPGTYNIVVSSGVNSLGGEPTAEYYNWGHPLGSPVPLVQNFLFPVGSFSGSKSVVLSTVTWIGGRNFFLGYAYLVVGIVCIVLAICFFIKTRLTPRDLGNAPYVSWNNAASAK